MAKASLSSILDGPVTTILLDIGSIKPQVMLLAQDRLIAPTAAMFVTFICTRKGPGITTMKKVVVKLG